jgi:hypothetical protein
MTEAEPHPRFVDRRRGAEIVSHECFPVSHRSLETWPLVWRRVNGKAITSTDELLAEARRRLDAAPAIRGGRRRP